MAKQMSIKLIHNPNLKFISIWKTLQCMVEKAVSFLAIISKWGVSEGSFVVMISHSSKQPELLSSCKWQAITFF